MGFEYNKRAFKVLALLAISQNPLNSQNEQTPLKELQLSNYYIYTLESAYPIIPESNYEC